MNALGVAFFSSAARLDPAVGDEVADKPARRLEALAGFRRPRVQQMVAEQIAISPVIFLSGQPEPFQSAFQGRIAQQCCGFRCHRPTPVLKFLKGWVQSSLISRFDSRLFSFPVFSEFN